MPIEEVDLRRLMSHLKFDSEKAIREMYHIDLSRLDPEFERKLQEASSQLNSLLSMWRNKRNEVGDLERAAMIRRCGCFTRRANPVLAETPATV
jgi:hypothetical protein